MDELSAFVREMERKLLKKCCEETELPENIWLLMDCLVAEGCPAKAVLNGFVKFGELSSLEEMLKGVFDKKEEE